MHPDISTNTRFLCDEMVAGLARWLRAAGYDTAQVPLGGPDGLVLAQAVREGRLLLTRDRGILQRKAAPLRVVLLVGDGIDSWAQELVQRLDLDWRRAPFSRCLACNTPLVAAPSEALAQVPATLRGSAPVSWCGCCLKAFWPGGHVRRMAARLDFWAERRPH